MTNRKHTHALCRALVYVPENNCCREDEEWFPHPSFTGVHLRNLVFGAETGGSFSAHLVRVDPGRSIGDHAHETQWEMHQVLQGDGSCATLNRVIDYEPGVCVVLPRGSRHRVTAGVQGLFLVATFAPALV